MAGVGGDMLGSNLYAYCFNNPVNMSDPDGDWAEWLKNGIKWVAKNVVKPVAKAVKSALSNVDLTYSTGVNLSGGNMHLVDSVQAGISIDTEGNVAIQLSLGAEVSTSNSNFSFTKYETITTAPSVEKLQGVSYQIGVSGGAVVDGIPINAGGDINIMPDGDKTYIGITTYKGIGLPGFEAHAGVSDTASFRGSTFNIFKIGKVIYDKIMEW